ncbi:MAG TPA: SDR family oxidoreductase [Burkholderiales bacterium]
MFPRTQKRDRALTPNSVGITGASSGIGEALARHYASPDSTLGLISRRPAGGGLPGTIVPYSVDVTDAAGLERAAADFVARHGSPDLVIANAGVGVGTRSDDIADVEKLRRVLEVNLTGLAATLAAFAPAMRKAGHGTLAGIASVAGFRGLAGNGAYCASKAAAITWLESLRTELYGSGVSVVCVCPGYIDTPMTRVNRYRMPFLLPADEAARRIARAIAARRRLAVIPWQMAAVSVLLRAMPGWLYDRLAARAPRKPRDISI